MLMQLGRSMLVFRVLLEMIMEGRITTRITFHEAVCARSERGY